jgi:hypothetical protein
MTTSRVIAFAAHEKNSDLSWSMSQIVQSGSDRAQRCEALARLIAVDRQRV